MTRNTFDPKGTPPLTTATQFAVNSILATVNARLAMVHNELESAWPENDVQFGKLLGQRDALSALSVDLTRTMQALVRDEAEQSS